MLSWKSLLRTLAFQSGLLGLIHRIRNRNTLTVFMFHRVLPDGSKEYAYAEREFTFGHKRFSQCIEFIEQHYNVVSLEDIKAYFGNGVVLPRRAALITFDDGWRDTALFALPELRKRSLPALLFLATEVLDSKAKRWWQDALVEVVSQPDGLEKLEAELKVDRVTTDERASRIRHLTAKLGVQAEDDRLSILRAYVSNPIEDRQMLTRDDIANLEPIAIAGHGHSHVPLTELSDPLGDLQANRDALKEIGAKTDVMSFPHGAVNDEVLEKAHQAGFEICFSSDPVLLDTSKPANRNSLIGRIHIPENQWTCDAEGISQSKLATFFFFRPIV